MSEQTRSAQNATRREKRPPLTHFLCFPLVNETSLPQLEASLAKFQSAIPLRPKTENGHPLKPRPPLFPDAAIRPVGTLHLTLGVMSLTTPERLEAAVQLLHSLDLASMLREAEAQARRPLRKRGPLVTPTNPDGPDSEPPATSEVKDEEDIALLQQPVLVAPAEPTPQKRPLEPLSVSLESLHALPKAKAATVLYASPVDATSRLYPFSVMLRDKFLEAGLLEGEYKKSKAKNHVQDGARETEEGNKEGIGDSALGPEETANHQCLLEEVPTGVAEEPPPSADRKRHQTKVKKPKPRPLLLHATVVNTIYVRGRRRENNNNDNNNKKNNNRKERKNGPLTFDARGIISHYKDYYLDETRTQARPFPIDPSEETEQQITVPSEEEEETSLTTTATSEEEEGEGQEVDEDDTPSPPSKKLKTTGGGQQSKYPFIWAENLPLEKLCICEMGARTPDEDNALAARLGQEYRIVAERSLLDLDQQQQQRDHHDVEVDVDIQEQQEEAEHVDTESTDSSVDGGVRISM